MAGTDKIVKNMKEVVKEQLLAIDSVEKLQMLVGANIDGSVQTFGYAFTTMSMFNTISFEKEKDGDTTLCAVYKVENYVVAAEYVSVAGIESVSSKINDFLPEEMVDIDIKTKTGLLVKLSISYVNTAIKEVHTVLNTVKDALTDSLKEEKKNRQKSTDIKRA